MACFHPLACFGVVNARSGKLSIKFSGPGEPMQVPCGQCIGCRLERSRQWAARCVHESSLHSENCFITLTYSDDKLPIDGSLVKHHFQDFMKRLRRNQSHRDEFQNLWHLPIRFFHCGEYGELLRRPHYHALLFGMDFKDRELFSERDGIRVYVSDLLSSIWGKGFCTVGDLTFESAAYCARYIVKKITGDAAYSHYVSPDGVMLEREYTTMSRRSGIGRDWYDQFSSDVFPSDEVVLRGKVMKPPRYYQKLFQVEDAEGHEALLAKRKSYFCLHQADCTPERLRSREIVQGAAFSLLKRGYENEA